jgi:hypothetical protein
MARDARHPAHAILPLYSETAGGAPADSYQCAFLSGSDGCQGLFHSALEHGASMYDEILDIPEFFGSTNPPPVDVKV